MQVTATGEQCRGNTHSNRSWVSERRREATRGILSFYTPRQTCSHTPREETAEHKLAAGARPHCGCSLYINTRTHAVMKMMVISMLLKGCVVGGFFLLPHTSEKSLFLHSVMAKNNNMLLSWHKVNKQHSKQIKTIGTVCVMCVFVSVYIPTCQVEDRVQDPNSCLDSRLKVVLVWDGLRTSF